MYEHHTAKFLEQYISERGISLRYIANNTSIKYELLRRSIHDHTRKLGADEFLEILDALNIKLVLNEKETEIKPAPINGVMEPVTDKII